MRLGPALDRFELLDAEGDATERTGIATGGDATIDLGRRGHRAIGVEVHERVERRVEPVDSLEVVLEDFDRPELAPSHPSRDRRRVHLVKLHRRVRLAVVHIQLDSPSQLSR